MLMEERLKLSRNSTTEEVDATEYQRPVGSLRYSAAGLSVCYRLC